MLVVTSIVIGSAFAGWARAETLQPSFDCRKATSSVERSICISPELSALDSQLAQVFAAASARTADKVGLRKDQNKWRTTIRDKCRSSECIADAYGARTRALSVTAENGRVLVLPGTGSAPLPPKTSVIAGGILYGTLVFDHDAAGGFTALQVGDRQYKLRYVGSVPESLAEQINRLEDASQTVSILGDLIVWPDGTKAFDDRSRAIVLIPKK
ncbi:lysozyme inhibitor LprI family protein [Pandoraea sp. PE-S2T-3]|uniref:lysozyme inhibitor LprI family protein n=1 Tax=Pandoraea sp. PE-S2T-3 TaxID=1986993 RepID=UPI0015956849|nr:lysozyme inhibitor LprI family protein [Pandoraea sp. PE-S2T-3]